MTAKKILSLILLCVTVSLLFVSCAASAESPTTETEAPPPTYTAPRKILVTDQKNRSLRIYDIDKKDWSRPDWSWTSDEPTFTAVDGVKYRYDNNAKTDVLALCSSGGYVAVISYPTGDVISYIRDAGGNPHSVEILPDGFLVLAASHGNYVRIYDATSFGDISKKYKEVTVPDAHGVLWDPEMEVLWALGRNRLYAFEITKSHNLVENEELSIDLPTSGGHDLQPVYGKPDWFWVTTVSHVYQVNKKTKEVSTRYPGWVTLSLTSNVKGIGNFPDGTVVYGRAENVYAEWNTDTVYIGTLNPEIESFEFVARKIPNVAYYKLRVLERDYLGDPPPRIRLSIKQKYKEKRYVYEKTFRTASVSVYGPFRSCLCRTCRRRCGNRNRHRNGRAFCPGNRWERRGC